MIEVILYYDVKFYHTLCDFIYFISFISIFLLFHISLIIPTSSNNYHFNIKHRDLGSNNSTADSTPDFNLFLERSGLTEVKTKRKLPSTSKSNQIKDEELNKKKSTMIEINL